VELAIGSRKTIYPLNYLIMNKLKCIDLLKKEFSKPIVENREISLKYGISGYLAFDSLKSLIGNHTNETYAGNVALELWDAYEGPRDTDGDIDLTFASASEFRYFTSLLSEIADAIMAFKEIIEEMEATVKEW
jgi:hypothetical protein